jgi:hypothetical protein
MLDIKSLYAQSFGGEDVTKAEMLKAGSDEAVGSENTCWNYDAFSTFVSGLRMILFTRGTPRGFPTKTVRGLLNWDVRSRIARHSELVGLDPIWFELDWIGGGVHGFRL